MFKEQKIRGFLFYTAVAVFVLGLPFILSSALGYKFDRRTFKFTKTGIISIRTEPEGALIYFDGKLLKDKTPASIRELLPARYNLRLELENHYLWSGDVFVDAGQVARLENIILFPVRPNISTLNKEKITAFWVDEEKGRVYYFDSGENLVYTSDLKGENFQDVALIPGMALPFRKWKVSPDRKRVFFFNSEQIIVADLEAEEGRALPDAAVILNFPGKKFADVFWHSDSFHLIAVTDRGIEAIEVRADARPVALFPPPKAGASCFYNEKEDALYFLDYQSGSSKEGSGNLLKLDLNVKSSLFQNLLRTKSDEQH
jgi:hypothetical protein